MAAPIQKISRAVKTEQPTDVKSLESLLSAVADKNESLEQAMNLLQELYDSGILEALTAMVVAKEKIAKIAVEQALRPEATTLINNMMSALGGLTKLDPEMTGTLLSGLAQGLEDGKQSLQNSKKIGVLDLGRALNDPDVNRTLKFAMGFLKGFGKSMMD
ncbi:DUF1641 domain-containing protein [Ferroacidibacillus organovorans]|uniref:DUF1641 domain-containing protein n=1 Tax=Ferroacidibacillus organovorans TaxID=1765683 RepID=A0A853KFP1_9BACL|nr:DUF1641 domain-containing protein [Ferroacidibacillus organovorans]KYP81341.1 hypothetical protein AYJ22_00815 [Ferroacidibacillus organovorans]OAG95128.1 hypothetical protein AYW79_01415 [Ferroacidibacillus organovorans]